MKKLYTIAGAVAMLVSANLVNGQNLIPGPTGTSTRQPDMAAFKEKFQNVERGGIGQWLFWDDPYANYFVVSTPQPAYVNYLFPDTTIMVDGGSNPDFNTWTHGVGQAYDLNSPVWGFSNTNIDFTQPIKIDSILVWGWYNRINNTTADTLQINLHKANTGFPFNNLYYLTGVPDLGVDTAFFCDIAYTQATNTVTNPAWSYKIVLDAAFFADSAADGTHQHVIVPSSPLTVTLNGTGHRKGAFGFSETFIPGYTHNPNVDVIGVDQNGYRPIATELNGDDTYPSVSQIGDVTTAYLLPSNVRANAAGTWNGHWIPSLAFVQGFAWEYVYIVPYISQSNTLALDENHDEVNFGIYPNPASDNANFKVVSKFSGDAVISIIDLTGKVVKQFTNLHVQEGNNTFNLAVNDINSGAYIAQLTTNGHQISTRLIVSK